MNKRHFLALIATLFITLGAFAQGNTYNMVLTLADETKIIIGPNDLTKLEFVEGNLTTEGGTNIIELMNQMKALQASIVAVQADVANTQTSVAAAMEMIKANKNELQTDISSLAASVNALNKSVDAKIADNYDKMKTYTDEAMKKTEAELKEYTNDAVNKLHAEIAENKEVITNEYNKAIDESKDEILVLINANTANIEKNAAGIDKNKDAIIELVKKLRDAGIRI